MTEIKIGEEIFVGRRKRYVRLTCCSRQWVITDIINPLYRYAINANLAIIDKKTLPDFCVSMLSIRKAHKLLMQLVADLTHKPVSPMTIINIRIECGLFGELILRFDDINKTKKWITPYIIVFTKIVA